MDSPDKTRRTGMAPELGMGFSPGPADNAQAGDAQAEFDKLFRLFANSFLLRTESGAMLRIELKDAAKLEQANAEIQELQQKLDAALADVANARLVDAQACALVDAQASAARKEAEYWQNGNNAASRLVDEKDQVSASSPRSCRR